MKQTAPTRRSATKRRSSRPRLKRESVRIVEYMLSGGLYFWSGYAAFFVCDRLLHMDLFWAKLISNVLGWSINYGLQRAWVFRDGSSKRHRTEVTFRYAVITLVDFLLDYLIVRGLKENGVSPYIGQFISAGFFTVWNYFWYKSWVFTSRLHRHHKVVRK